MFRQVLLRCLIEYQGTQGSSLMDAAKVLKVVIQAGVQRNGHRVVDDAVRPGRFRRPLVQGEQRGLGHTVEMSSVDDWHGADCTGR